MALCTGCGGNALHHMETDDESNAIGAMHCGSSWFLWQFRNLNIPQRKYTVKLTAKVAKNRKVVSPFIHTH
jgi:hypothetical protein